MKVSGAREWIQNTAIKNVTHFTSVQMQRIKQKFANSLSEEQHKIQRLQRELEKERLNSLRIQQKLEQDFDFHKQMVVNDCGRHIEGICFNDLWFCQLKYDQNFARAKQFSRITPLALTKLILTQHY